MARFYVKFIRKLFYSILIKLYYTKYQNSRAIQSHFSYHIFCLFIFFMLHSELNCVCVRFFFFFFCLFGLMWFDYIFFVYFFFLFCWKFQWRKITQKLENCMKFKKEKENKSPTNFTIKKWNENGTVLLLTLP